MNQLTWNVVQWVIAFKLGTEATGVFTGCLTIAFLSNPFVLGIAGVIFPRMAQIRNNEGIAAMRRLVAFATIAMGLVMISFTLVLLVAGQLFCDFLYADPAYATAGLLTAMLAAAVSCLAITMPIDAGLFAERRTDLSSASSGIGLGVTVISVAMLVHWGTTAAAAGLLIGCIFEVAARIIFFLRLSDVPR
jgi:O-antigen/teichoic acid export membrane protein